MQEIFQKYILNLCLHNRNLLRVGTNLKYQIQRVKKKNRRIRRNWNILKHCTRKKYPKLLDSWRDISVTWIFSLVHLQIRMSRFLLSEDLDLTNQNLGEFLIDGLKYFGFVSKLCSRFSKKLSLLLYLKRNI